MASDKSLCEAPLKTISPDLIVVDVEQEHTKTSSMSNGIFVCMVVFKLFQKYLINLNEISAFIVKILVLPRILRVSSQNGYIIANQSIITMRTIIILFFTLLFFNTGSAQVTLEDDGLHFAVGAAISSGTYAYVYSKTKNKSKAFWYSFGLSSLAGFAKEFYDGNIITGKFDNSEMISTMLGGLSASYTFNIFTGKRKKKKEKNY